RGGQPSHHRRRPIRHGVTVRARGRGHAPGVDDQPSRAQRQHTMTEPEDSNRPISVAEVLARNDTSGAPPVGGRRRRRRGNAGAITVAELTGEIPVVGDDTEPEDAQKDGSGPDGSGRAAPVETPAERTDEQELPGPTGRTDLPKRETPTPAPDRDRTGQDRSAHRAQIGRAHV